MYVLVYIMAPENSSTELGSGAPIDPFTYGVNMGFIVGMHDIIEAKGKKKYLSC